VPVCCLHALLPEPDFAVYTQSSAHLSPASLFGNYSNTCTVHVIYYLSQQYSKQKSEKNTYRNSSYFGKDYIFPVLFQTENLPVLCMSK
jgi:hypothetical protein